MVVDARGPSDEVVATRVEAALLLRFPSHPADDVRLAVQHAQRAFDAARVRTYLAVLVERAAAERLAAGVFDRGQPPGEAAPGSPSRAAILTATLVNR